MKTTRAFLGILTITLGLAVQAQAQFTWTNNNGAVTITGYTGSGGAVTIPSTINSLPVTSIGDAAFYSGANPWRDILTSVTIPNSVTNIGGLAFAWDGRLTNVTLGNGLMSIGAGAFGDCGLTTITIPRRVISIGDNAFAYCGNLTGVYFQGNAPALGSGVFEQDNNIVFYLPGTSGWGPTFGGRPTAPWDPQVLWMYTTNNGTITITRYIGSGGAVSIPSTINGLPVTSIGDQAFWLCTSLTSLAIPNGVTSIGQEAFFGCTSLTGIAIPDSVTTIGIGAFSSCTSLTRVTIPNRVTSIGIYAFETCPGLTAVYFQGNAPSLGDLGDSSVFYGDNNATVYYLPGTTGWGPTFDGRPTPLWNPQAQSRDGSFGVRSNGFGFNITGTANIPILIEACELR